MIHLDILTYQSPPPSLGKYIPFSPKPEITQLISGTALPVQTGNSTPMSTKTSKLSILPPSYPVGNHGTTVKKQSVTISPTTLSNHWKMIFQATDNKGQYFLDLYDRRGNLIEPYYKNGGSWLSQFGISNSLCTRMTRLITNHTPIDDYKTRFFPNENLLCPCGSGQIETRVHILHKCTRYNEAWRPLDSLLSSVITFLNFNNSSFCFKDR